MNSYNGFTAAQRTRAQHWLTQQWKAGTIVRATRCCACGQDQGPIDAHAESYSEPFGPHLVGFPLCYVCHMAVHCRFKNPGAWDRYRAFVATGCQTAPIFGRSFSMFVRICLGPHIESAGSTRHAPPTRLVLDTIETWLMDHGMDPTLNNSLRPPQLEVGL